MDVAEDLVAERGGCGGGFGAELGDLFAEMPVKGIGAGIGACNLGGEIGGEKLHEAWVGSLDWRRWLAQQRHEDEDNGNDLNGQERVEHFGFPSLVCLLGG
jgi:hypothetical protein